LLIIWIPSLMRKRGDADYDTDFVVDTANPLFKIALKKCKIYGIILIVI
jgi:hypothetical protein